MMGKLGVGKGEAKRRFKSRHEIKRSGEKVDYKIVQNNFGTYLIPILRKGK